MSTLTDFITAVRAFAENISALASKKPQEATLSDDATLLSSVSKATLLAAVQTKVTTHTSSVANPHATTAAKLSGVDKVYVDDALATAVPLSVLPMSQYGDTTQAALGLTTSGFVLNFTKPIQAYVLGTFKMFPVMSIALTTVDPSPANKTFYIYVTVKDGDLAYLISATKLAESLSLMWVGKVVTNGTAISTLQIGRVSRIGATRITTGQQGASIPTTAGSPTAPAKLNAAWLP
jgi:hypothetical protein